MHIVKGYGGFVILNLLVERVGQTGETAHSSRLLAVLALLAGGETKFSIPGPTPLLPDLRVGVSGCDNP